MASKCPRISVIMSVFNGELYLRESIETILNQTYSDFEFIIIDDCSTDFTAEIISEYSSKDSRIKLYRNNGNLGLTRSLNKAIQFAQGEYIARQDADDVALPLRFEKQVQILDKSTDVVMASCNIAVIDAEGNPFDAHMRSCHPDLAAWLLLFYNHIAGHSQVMFRRSTIEQIGGYSENRPYSQDYELWSRIIYIGKIYILPEVLQKQRLHSKSVSAVKRLDQNNLSIIQARSNISQLLKQDLSFEELECIRRFWTGSYWWSSFPCFRKASSLHIRLKTLYKLFIEQFSSHRSNDVDLSCRLRFCIAQQFVYWMQSTRIFSYSRIKLSYYTFLWSPSALVEFWLAEFWRVLSNKLFASPRLGVNSQVSSS